MITNLGGSALMLPFALAIALALLFARAWRLAGLWSLIFLAGMLLVVTTKALFFGWGIGAQAIDFTGISGHTMLFTAIFPTAVYLILHRQSLRTRMLAILVAMLLGVAVAISRVMLNAHSISEVIAGTLLGFMVSGSFIWLLRREPEPDLSGRGLFVVFALLFALLYGHEVPTNLWLRDVSAAIAGREHAFARTIWHKHVHHPQNTQQCGNQPCTRH